MKDEKTEFQQWLSSDRSSRYEDDLNVIKLGDKVKYIPGEKHHWFTNRVENAKKLDPNKIYTVSQIRVASSSTAVRLEETGDLDYELCWFEKI